MALEFGWALSEPGSFLRREVFHFSTCQEFCFKVHTHMPRLPSAATPFISLSLWVERRQDPRGQRHCPRRGQLVPSVSFVLRSSLSAWGRASLLKSVKVDLTRGLLPLWPEGRAELLAGENRVEKHELWVSGPGVRFRCLCAAAKPGLPTARLWVRWPWC